MGPVNVSIARYALGVVALAVVCGSVGAAAVALRRRLLPDFAGAPARLSEAVIGLAVLVAILEVLGTVGLFRLVPVVLACVAAGAGVTAWAARGVRDRERARRPLRGGALVLAVVACAAVAAEWSGPALDAYDYGIRTFDSLWYHLPWAASFAQTGHITGLHFDLEFLLAFYPATGELLHGLGVVMLGRDTLSPVLNLLWLALALLAAWCIGRPKGRGAQAVLGVAIVLAAPMMYFSQPGSADDDVLGVFLLLASAGLLMQREAGARAPLVLAAVAAGLAVEIKLSLLAPVFLLTVGVLITEARGRRAALWLGPLALAGGYWYLRNLVAIGNPLPWSSFGVLATPAPPLQQHNTYSIAHYLTDSNFWSHFFVSGMASQLGRWWWAILAVAVIGPLLCLAPGSSSRLRMLALVGLLGLAGYVVTPNSAMGPDGDPVGFAFNLRFAAPPMALALAVLPLAPVFDRGRRRQAGLSVVLAAVLVATVAEGSLWPGRHTGAVLAVGLVVLGGGVALAGLEALGRPRRGALALSAALAAVVVAVAAAGYPVQKHYLTVRYTFRPSVSRLSGVWAYFRKVHHARVGIAGTYAEFFSYPLFGLDDTNRVTYVARHGPHGSFTPITSCREWRRSVNAGHFKYLITTPDRDYWRASQLQPAPEGGWTRSDPAAHLLIRRRVTGQPVEVFVLHGSLSQAGCPGG